jgi:hypothetical protein
MKFDIIKEVILVSRKKQFAVVISCGADFDFCLDSLYLVMASLVVAMNYCIVDSPSPNEVPLSPDAAKNVHCP